MDNQITGKIGEFAKTFCQRKFIESGYIALRHEDGIAITVAKADLCNLGEDDVVFVNDKNIESFEGNFRAAAVILFCAIRQDKSAEAAAIVDSNAILEFSSKRKPLQPVLDGVAKVLGVNVKCASKNVAAEIVAALSGYRNACFMPDAGAVVRARSLKELVDAVDILDKACNADILAENKGGTQHINAINAFIEQVAYKISTSKNMRKESKNVSETTADVKDDQNSEQQTDGNGGQQTARAEENCENEIKESETENNDLKADIVRKAFTQDGKTAVLACSRYAGAVAAIGKPMAVTDEFKEEFGEEIPCMPSKLILSAKAFEKFLTTVNANVCLFAQHGVVIIAESEEDALNKLQKVEDACKAYLN